MRFKSRFLSVGHRHAITSPSFPHWLAFKLSPSTECLFQLSYFSGLKFPFSSSYLLFLCRNFQCFHLFLSTFIIVYCNIFMMDALKSQVILTTLSPSNWYLIVFFIQFKIFLSLGMMSDFHLKPGHFGYYYQTLHLIYTFHFRDWGEVRPHHSELRVQVQISTPPLCRYLECGREAPCYCHVEIEPQDPHP